MCDRRVDMSLEEARRQEKRNEIEYNGEFDPGSGRTLAACLTHASQGERSLRGASKLANG